MKQTITLKKNYEFEKIFSKGKYINGKYICAYMMKNHMNINKIGIAISKKVGKSVQRNRIKRLIRENYRMLENDINLGNNIVFLWKKNTTITDATYKNIEEDMKNIINRVK